MDREKAIERETRFLKQIRESTKECEGEENPHAIFATEKNQAWPYFREVAEHVDFSGARVLDVGCGYGWLLDFLETEQGSMPTEYVGIDQAPAVLTEAKKKWSEDCPKYKFYEGLWPDPIGYEHELLSERSKLFDVAMLIGLIVERDAHDLVYDLVRPALRCAKVVAFEILWENHYGGRLRAHKISDVVAALECSPWVKEIRIATSLSQEGALFIVRSSHENFTGEQPLIGF